MNWFEGKKIVVPMDFSEQSYHAVDEAIAMASGSSHVYVVHAAAHPLAMAPEVIWQDMSDEMRRSKIENCFKQKFQEITNPKHQITNKFQITMTKIPNKSQKRGGLLSISLQSLCYLVGHLRNPRLRQLRL